MKKILPVIIVLVLLGIGGYFYLSSKGKVPTSGLGNNTNNIFSSIKDALSKSISLKCVYKNEQGVETTTYIKNGAVRVMTTESGDTEQPNNFIIKDKKMYMWSDVNKTGFAFSVPDSTSTTPYPTAKEDNTMFSPEKSNSQDQESVLAEIEKYKDACKAETIADSMFSIPTDVKFQDMDALQEQMMENIPQAPEGDNQEEMQKYIEEMMQQQGQ